MSVVDKLDPSDASAPSMFSKAFHCLGRNRAVSSKPPTSALFIPGSSRSSAGEKHEYSVV